MPFGGCMPGPHAPAGGAGCGGCELGVEDVLDAAGGAGGLRFGAVGLGADVVGADVVGADRVCAVAFWIPSPPLIAPPTPTPTPTPISATAPNSAGIRRQADRRKPDFNLDILPPFVWLYVLKRGWPDVLKNR